MNRLFIDMDGVIVEENDAPEFVPYRHRLPVRGAIDAVKELSYYFDCWIVSKPTDLSPEACANKVSWLSHHLPQMQTRLILTHNKSILGDSGDWLIDDKPWKCQCEEFPGRVIRFGAEITWEWLLPLFTRALFRLPNKPKEVSDGT
jgi:5'(3')-deoxyribonucleotidase